MLFEATAGKGARKQRPLLGVHGGPGDGDVMAERVRRVVWLGTRPASSLRAD